MAILWEYKRIILLAFLFFPLPFFPADVWNPEKETISLWQNPSAKNGKKVEMDIYLFRDASGKLSCGRNLLVLPGYKFSRHRWIRETRLLEIARSRKYCLVLPEMGRAVYESRFYPETTNNAFSVPSLVWLRDTAIPHLQREKKMLLHSQKNFLLGNSTGGRGVALVHLALPDLFTAGAALSGDFDQTRMPEDYLMRAIYGPYRKFPSRWREDNPVFSAGKWKMHLYLSHGKNDRVVPFEQSRIFYHELQKNKKDKLYTIIFHETLNEHDFTFWNRELPGVFAFFDKF